MSTVKEAFVKICGLLNKFEVDFIVIGGLAVVYHGFPRTTADADFWYKPTTENFNKIIQAFVAFGVDTSELNNLVFDPDKSFLRIPALGIKAEFLPKIPGLNSFDLAQRNAVKAEIDGVHIFLLGYEDLLNNKATLGRPKDIQDIEELKKRKEGK